VLAFEKAQRLSRAEERGGIPFRAAAPCDGLVLGEGAGFFVLENSSAAKRRNASPLATIVACVTGYEPGYTAHPIALRKKLVKIVQSALETAGLNPGDIDFWSASANGERLPDQIELAAMLEVFSESDRRPQLIAVKSSVGECLGASGPFQTAAALEAISGRGITGLKQEQIVDDEVRSFNRGLLSEPGTKRYALITAMGGDGILAAVVISCHG
jgi:act minimal PKS ketosynthase (KS/KS alpha)